MINTITEVSRCLLCLDAPCTEACPKSLDPARGIRALLFEDDNADRPYWESVASVATSVCSSARSVPYTPEREYLN